MTEPRLFDDAWTPADAAVRRRIVEDLDRPLVVEAGAGTGKTTLLVDRLLRALEMGVVTMDGVVAISFTEKAAAELRWRLRQALEARAARAADGAPRLQQALGALHRAQISTIHAYASALLRERPAEARLDPQFRVLDEMEALQLLRDFWRRWVDDELEDAQGAMLLRAALQSGVRLDPDLRGLVRALYDNRDLVDLLPAAARATELEPRMQAFRAQVDACRQHARDHCRDRDDRARVHLEQLAQQLEALDDLDPGAWPVVFLQGMKVQTHLGRRDRWLPGALAANKAARLALQATLLQLQEDLRSRVLGRSLQWTQRFLAAYAQEKRRLGVVDFQDLLLEARTLLRDDIAVRRDLGTRVRMLCVDEFQDTDPLQAEMVLYLAEEGAPAAQWTNVHVGAKLFLVGDPKQSIYRFRRADLDVYGRCCDIVRRSGGEVVDVVQNFRSRPAILQWTNGVFAALFGAGAAVPPQPRHVPLVPLPDPGGVPAVWIVTPPAATAAAMTSADAARRSEAQALVGFVRRALDAAWPVRILGGKRPLQPGDVALLFARTSGIEHYEDALRAAGLPFRQEGGRLFFQRQEVRDVLHALAAIDDPGDELALVAALRSPLCGASDAALLAHRVRFGRFDYLASKPDSPLADALDLFATLHAERHARGVGGCTVALLERTAARAVYGAQPQGDRAVANFETLLRRARDFEASRPAGLRDFVASLRDLDEEAPRLAEWAPEEESPEQVRLLTVHMAKGLEFPCVVLANLSARGSLQQESVVYDRVQEKAELRLQAQELRTTLDSPGYAALAAVERERERAEEKRLLYVAATRARDYLAVGAFAGKRAEGLLGALADVPGALGDRSFGELPEPVRVVGATPEAVWCVLEAADAPPARRVQKAPPPDPALETLRRGRRAWPSTHTARLQRGRAGLQVAGPASASVSVPRAGLETLLHAVLEIVPLEANEALREGAVRDAAARLGAASAVEPLLDMLRRVWEHPVLDSARAAPRRWMGLRLVDAFGAGTIAARVDLAYAMDDGVNVVGMAAGPRQATPASDRELVLGAFMLARSGHAVREVGRLWLDDASYERLEDLPARLDALAKELASTG